VSDSGAIGEVTPRTLWEDSDRGLSLELKPIATPAIVRLIGDTQFGSGGLRYRRLDVDRLIERRQPTAYLSLRQGDRLLASYVLTGIKLSAGGECVDGVYRALLCVAADAQGQGFGRLMVTEALKWLDTRAGELARPLLSYGCVERANSRPQSLLGASGAREIGFLHTQMVYRQWPRRRLELLRLDGQTSAKVKDAQSDASADCCLAPAEPMAATFFAVANDAMIMAGAHARIVRINFDRIGGPWDFLSERIFAHVGPARRRFDPRNFTYLQLDGVVAQPGCGRLWRDFLSTLMAEHGVHMAMFTLDPTRQLSARLERSRVFGRVARATRQELAVIVSGHGAGAARLVDCRGEPLAVAPCEH